MGVGGGGGGGLFRGVGVVRDGCGGASSCTYMCGCAGGGMGAWLWGYIYDLIFKNLLKARFWIDGVFLILKLKSFKILKTEE